MGQKSEPIRVPDPKRPKSRRSAFSRVVVSLFAIALVVGLVGSALTFYAYIEFTSQGPLKAGKIHVIQQGVKRAEIGAELEDAGIVSSAGVFTAAAYVNGFFGGHLKAGEYEFPESASIDQVLSIITSGRAVTYKVTVPEGWTSEMAAARVAENDVLSGEVTKVPAEGAIMPDTYVFRRGLTRQKMLEDMQAAQNKLLDELWNARAPSGVLKSKEEAVTLASIVEKETGVPEERPLVASVFVNRLRQGIRLQSDPTIIYGLVGGKGKLDRGITRDDLASNTPYNTYQIDGLPPGPIANPGRASLEAVLNPPDTGYVYFVANGTGGHAFAKTLEEHNANVKKWRAMENGQVALQTTEAPTEVVVDGMPVPATPPAAPEAPAPAVEPVTPVAEPVTPVAEPVTPVEPAQPVEAAKPAEPAKPPAEAEKPAEVAAAAETPVVEEKPLKPGTWIMVENQMVPIPKQKPKQ